VAPRYEENRRRWETPFMHLTMIYTSEAERATRVSSRVRFPITFQFSMRHIFKVPMHSNMRPMGAEL